MRYHNEINTQYIDSQVIGILVVIPVTGIESSPVIATYLKCENCNFSPKFNQKFCSECGGKIIEITEPLLNRTQEVPSPDVRNEMSEFGIDKHFPFREDFSDDLEGVNWVFPVKEYLTVGCRDSYEPFVDEFDLAKIQSDLAEAKNKFKNIITKYNGKVVFGVVGEHNDW